MERKLHRTRIFTVTAFIKNNSFLEKKIRITGRQTCEYNTFQRAISFTTFPAVNTGLGECQRQEVQTEYNPIH